MSEAAMPAFEANREVAAISAPIGPVLVPERVRAIDSLRGLSLLGILLMNISSFGLPFASYSDPSVYGGATGANLWFWAANFVLFEGKMRTLFMMLFGAGTILFTARKEDQGGGIRVADLYYRRILWMMALGTLHAYFLWYGDILFAYGFIGILLFPMRVLSGAKLVRAGAIMTVVMAAASMGEVADLVNTKKAGEAAAAELKAGKTLSESQREAQKAWEKILKERKPSASDIDAEVKAYRGGFGAVFKQRASQVPFMDPPSMRLATLLYFAISGTLILGMGLMKLGVFSAERSFAFYGRMMLGGFGAGLTISVVQAWWIVSHGFDLLAETQATVVHPVQITLVALGYAGLMMTICKAGALGWLTGPLAAVGQMALTNYLMDSLVCTTLFYGYGFGLFGKLERYQLLYVVAGLWAFQLIVSPLWLRSFRFGPVEWLWRSLTYWQKQPMRREAAA